MFTTDSKKLELKVRRVSQISRSATLGQDFRAAEGNGNQQLDNSHTGEGGSSSKYNSRRVHLIEQ